MNLFARLFWIYLTSRFRPNASPLGPVRTPFRCWPTDLDVLRHMNNGVYFSILDLARVDLMIRSGMMPKLNKLGWYPVVVAETMRFHKSLKMFDRFEIETRVIGWDDKAMLVEQVYWKGMQRVAEAVIRARFLKKSGGSVKTVELMDLMGITTPSPQLPDWVNAWNQSQAQ